MVSEILISTNPVTLLKDTEGKSHSLQSKLTSPFPLHPDASSRPRTAVVFYLRSSARRRTQPEGYPRAGPSRPARPWPPAATGGRPRPRGNVGGAGLGGAFVCSTRRLFLPFGGEGVCPSAPWPCPPPQSEWVWPSSLKPHSQPFRIQKQQDARHAGINIHEVKTTTK